ncbi:MAG: S-ribosylhomocysteine lyase [Clostridia bacterium]|nr:S-ribosylhomocysteine lyase [Clostridia bacterium]MBQ6805669.1 S-ribosylhomocysteine lyase [Clostridia bacterium]
MERIESFRVDHTRLVPGLYVSRRDGGEEKPVTTFDLRITRPNEEPVMDMPAIHTMEHLGATFLRNSEMKDDIIYFGPMGCRTGFYLVMFGKLTSEDVLPLVRRAFAFIAEYEGDIPGASAIECGNYQEQNLNMAHYYAKKYLAHLENPCLHYPD